MKLKLRNANLDFLTFAQRKEQYVTSLDGTIEYNGNYTKTYTINKSTSSVFSIVDLLGVKIEYGKEYNIELDYECDGVDLSSVRFVRKTIGGDTYISNSGSRNIGETKCTGTLKTTFNFDLTDGDTEKICSLYVNCKESVSSRKFEIKNVKIYYMGYE